MTFALANVTFVVAKGTFAEHNVTFRMDDATFVLLEGSAVVQGATRASHEAALVETGVALCRAAVAPLGRDEAFGAAVVSSHSLKGEGREFL